MKVTVCQLNNDPTLFEKDWQRLAIHCEAQESELVLLPEMPFYPWIAADPKANQGEKERAVKAHEHWLVRLEELGNAIVAYSKPIIDGDKFYNSAFLWSKVTGHQKVHTKYFFPEEEVFYEETWFDREPKNFELVEINGLKVGFLLCTEIWFTEHTRKYGQDGIDLLLVPRATGQASVDQWVRCGQTSSVIGGCYCLSSNRSGNGDDNFEWGGAGWITQPMDGSLLGVTSDEEPFITLEIDLSRSKAAKADYPLNVKN